MKRIRGLPQAHNAVFTKVSFSLFYELFRKSGIKKGLPVKAGVSTVCADESLKA